MWLDGHDPQDVTRPLSNGVLGLLLVCLVVALSAPARAQEDPLGPDPVASDLFRRGRALIVEGNWEEGCAKLELSMKRFAAPSTLMNIARCREHDGRIATAWALYRRALVLNLETDGEERRRELEELGKRAIASLEPRLPRLKVTLSSAVKGAVVSEEGQELPLDTAVPLDPGTHQLDVEAPGHATLRHEVVLREGVTTPVVLTLVPAPPLPTPPKASIPDDGDPAATSTPIWVWVVGSAGIAMAGVAVGFGIDARLTTDALVERCGEDQVCDEDAAFDPAPDNARKNRGLGLSIGFGLGALGALTAATIGLVTNADAPAVTLLPRAWPEGGGLVVQGRF